MVWLLSLIPLIPTHLPGEYDGLHGGQGTGCGGWGFTLLLRAVAALDLCAGRREMNLGWSWERPPFFWRCDGVTLKFPPQNAVDQLHDWIYVYIYIRIYRGFEGNLSRNTVIDYALSNTDSCHCRRVQPWSAKGVHWPEGRATTAAPEWVLQTCG